MLPIQGGEGFKLLGWSKTRDQREKEGEKGGDDQETQSRRRELLGGFNMALQDPDSKIGLFTVTFHCTVQKLRDSSKNASLFRLKTIDPFPTEGTLYFLTSCTSFSSTLPYLFNIFKTRAYLQKTALSMGRTSASRRQSKTVQASNQGKMIIISLQQTLFA